MKTLLNSANKALTLFILLFIFTVPFPYYIIPDIGGYISPFFEPIIKWAGKNLLGLRRPFTAEVTSDSTGMYIQCFLLFLISVTACLLWSFFEKRKHNKLLYYTQVFISYYLALQLLTYGLAKVFKTQFYLPEPNTLYTPLGQLHRDILFWSTVGVSRGYSIFLGMAEILPALLLFYRRTRGIGAILSMLVMANVVAINFCYDVSVKVFSVFLFFISCVLAAKEIKKIYYMVIFNKLIITTEYLPPMASGWQSMAYAFGKPAAIGIILFESFFIYFRTMNFNDDKAARPFLHGAYKVISFSENGDTLPPLLSEKERFKRIFIHRKGYFISQGMNDEMADYELITAPEAKRFFLKQRNGSISVFNFTYSEKDSLLMLTGKLNNKSLNIVAKKMDLNKLPLLEKGFHPTTDDY